MNYKRITVKTLSKIAIGLLVIIAIAVFSNTFQNDVFEMATQYGESIAELKTMVANNDEIIAQAETKIAEAEEKLPELNKKKEAAEKKLDEENAALDTVCDRSKFSSLFCEDPLVCESFHDAVSKAESDYTNAKNKAYECEQTISNAKENIEYATEQKSLLNEQIDEFSVLKAKASWSVFFLIVAMLLVFAGFVFISNFMLDKTSSKKGLIACAMLAVASFIYMFLPTATTAFTYLLGIIIFAIFAGLISEKIQKRVTARVFAIILSIIVFWVTFIFAPFTAILSAITFILISLILVPCVFTEYLDIAKHIFFTIITFGIWHLIWMYNHTENLNKVEQAENRAPVRELLLCAFLPLYYIFWTYKTAGNTELYGEENGKTFKIDILCLALSVINPLLASVIIQDKTNIIVGKPVVEETEVVAEEPVVEESTVEQATEEAVVE